MSNVSTKEFRIGIVAVIAALAITSYVLIKKVETATPVETKYVFNPDRIAQMKPRFVHLIQNQADLDTLQNDPFVMNKNLLSIGAAIYTGSDGYGIFPQKTLNDPQQMFHVEQINSTDSINGKYPINAILTREPFPVDMIQTEGELNMVLRNSAIIDANLADIGAVVAQSPNGNYLIQKSILSEKYEALLIKE